MAEINLAPMLLSRPGEPPMPEKFMRLVEKIGGIFRLPTNYPPSNFTSAARCSEESTATKAASTSGLVAFSAG